MSWAGMKGFHRSAFWTSLIKRSQASLIRFNAFASFLSIFPSFLVTAISQAVRNVFTMMITFWICPSKYWFIVLPLFRV